MPQRHSILPRLAIVLALAAWVAPAYAQTWNEVGDAGSFIGTAQTTIGSGPLTTLNGTLSTPDDIDVYCITVGPTPRVLGLPVVTLQCVVNQGPTVWVFDASGVGVATNETCSGGGKTITTTLVSPGGPTTLYVAVAHYGVEPSSAGGPIWLPAVAGERTPDGPGAAGFLNGWAGTPVVAPLNPYQIGLGFATSCSDATPAPTTSWGSLKIRYGR
jgi:hypothetical protein